MAGYTVIDPTSVIATHLTELIKSHAPDLLGRQETSALLDNVKPHYPVVVDELVPNMLTVGEIQRVLQNLLRERIPIRNLLLILENLADGARASKDIDYLTERVRAAMARHISRRVRRERTAFGHHRRSAARDAAGRSGAPRRGRVRAARPDTVAQDLRVAHQADPARAARRPAADRALLAAMRLALKRLTERAAPPLVVLSYSEIAPGLQGRVDRPNLDDRRRASSRNSGPLTEPQTMFKPLRVGASRYRPAEPSCRKPNSFVDVVVGGPVRAGPVSVESIVRAGHRRHAAGRHEAVVKPVSVSYQNAHGKFRFGKSSASRGVQHGHLRHPEAHRTGRSLSTGARKRVQRCGSTRPFPARWRYAPGGKGRASYCARHSRTSAAGELSLIVDANDQGRTTVEVRFPLSGGVAARAARRGHAPRRSKRPESTPSGSVFTA